MTTVVADVLAGGAMAAGGWLFAEAIQVNKLIKHLTHRTQKLELTRR